MQCHDLGPHRVAYPALASLISKSSRQTEQHARGQRCQPAIGRAGDRILFMDHQWSTQQPGGNPGRTGDIAPQPEDCLGPQLDNQPYRRHE